MSGKPMKLTPMMEHILSGNGMHAGTIPAAGQTDQLHSVANIGSGGDSRDVTDAVHPGWAEIAARVRHALYDAVHVGIDLIAQNISLPPANQEWTIIEVNSNPDFGLP